MHAVLEYIANGRKGSCTYEQSCGIRHLGFAERTQAFPFCSYGAFCMTVRFIWHECIHAIQHLKYSTIILDKHHMSR